MSVVEAPFADERVVAARALTDLRRARRHKRLQNIHWVDAFYHVYLAAVVGGVLVVLVSNLVGGNLVHADTMRRVREHGPAIVGIAAALAVAIGLRSGSRGGPIALEGPDVRHVLMSVVDRGLALRGPAWRQLRFGLFVGTVTGAIAGVFAHRRLDHSAAGFIVCGAVFGACVAALGLGCALVASGRRLRPWLASAIGLVLVAWAVADATSTVGPVHAPSTFLGRLALWPLHVDLWAIVPVAVAVALVVLGVTGISGLSIEGAERRTRLVGQLRFAVTLQDLRTVLVLRRQLAMELPRLSPWYQPSFERRPKFPVWMRGLRGVLRWPASRLVRIVLLAVVAGLAMRAAWDGTIPMIVLAGLAFWVAALDAVEPMAQETDHPSLRDGYPVEAGSLMARHLPISAVVMTFVALLAAVVGVVVHPSSVAVGVAAIAFVPAGLAAMSGAAVSVVMGAPKPPGEDVFSFAPPEFAGAKNAMRAALPAAIAIIGTLPVMAARAAHERGNLAYGPEAAAAIGVLVVVLLSVGWVRMEQRIKEYWHQLMEEAAASQKGRQSQRAGAGGGR